MKTINKGKVISMKSYKHLAAFLFICLGAIFAIGPGPVLAQSKPDTSKTNPAQPSELRDGQHDFDWELGTWKVNISRLKNPLTGSTAWTELNGTVVVRKIWDGKGNLAEITADGPSGRLEFLAMRLYNPQARQWTNIFASSNSGILSVPMYGEFKNGRGEFYDQETFNGRTILVRFIFTPLTPDTGQSEQAFSDDGGKTWETNWINKYTRVKD